MMNAVSALLSGWMRMLWKAWAASKDEKYFAPARSIRTSPMLGTGKESAIVTAFSARKSTAHLVYPSFLATGTKGEPQGESAGEITPSFSLRLL